MKISMIYAQNEDGAIGLAGPIHFRGITLKTWNGLRS